MQWLIALFRDGLLWVFKNPLLLLLVLIVVAYNHFVPNGLPSINEIDMTNPASLLTALLAVGQFIFTSHGLLFWLATATGAAVTMFNTGVVFAVFAGKSNSIGIGLRRMLSVRTIQFLLLEIIIGFASAFLALGVIGSVVYLLPHSGIWGVAIIVIAAVLSYPVAYMALTVGAIIVGTTATLREKVHFAQVLLSGRNARRLCTFYLVRIGSEILIAYIALVVAQHVGVSSTLTGIVAILIMTIPLAFLRTTAFVMKLEMLRNTVWFREYFKSYYANISGNT